MNRLSKLFIKSAEGYPDTVGGRIGALGNNDPSAMSIGRDAERLAELARGKGLIGRGENDAIFSPPERNLFQEIIGDIGTAIKGIPTGAKDALNIGLTRTGLRDLGRYAGKALQQGDRELGISDQIGRAGGYLGGFFGDSAEGELGSESVGKKFKGDTSIPLNYEQLMARGGFSGLPPVRNKITGGDAFEEALGGPGIGDIKKIERLSNPDADTGDIFSNAIRTEPIERKSDGGFRTVRDGAGVPKADIPLNIAGLDMEGWNDFASSMAKSLNLDGMTRTLGEGAEGVGNFVRENPMGAMGGIAGAGLLAQALRGLRRRPISRWQRFKNVFV